MPNLTRHINPGRVVIATIGTGAMLALLASAALATNQPGATASASMSASESAAASQTAGNTVAGATSKLPSGAALVAQCRVLENTNGVDKDSWKTSGDEDQQSNGKSGDNNGDRDDLTASPMASASASQMATESPKATESASPMATESATTEAAGANATESASPTATESPKATESANPTESATASATASSSASPVVVRGGNEQAMAALDAACDKVMSNDKDDVNRASASPSASASNKADVDDQTAKASNKADPDDRNGLNGDDRNGNEGANGNSDSHQGRGHSNH